MAQSPTRPPAIDRMRVIGSPEAADRPVDRSADDPQNGEHEQDDRHARRVDAEHEEVIAPRHVGMDMIVEVLRHSGAW